MDLEDRRALIRLATLVDFDAWYPRLHRIERNFLSFWPVEEAYEHRRPTGWDDAYPWKSRVSANIARPGHISETTREAFYAFWSEVEPALDSIIREAWHNSAATLVSRLVEEGAISPSFAEIGAAAVRSEEAYQQVLSDGDADFISEFGRLRRADPGSVPALAAQDVVETIVLGITSNVLVEIAKAAIVQLRDVSKREETVRLSLLETQSFAEMYISSGLDATKFLLIASSEQTTYVQGGPRRWKPAKKWTHVFLTPTKEYTVEMTAEPGLEFPILLSTRESESTPDRYRNLSETGRHRWR